MNISQQQPPKKRKLGTLLTEECGCSIFAAMEVFLGVGDKCSPVNGKNQVYSWCGWNHRINGHLFLRGENLTIHNERVETIILPSFLIRIGRDLNYVMTPKRIGSKNEVHKGMGLIEVDMNNLESAKAWGIAGD